MATGWNAVASLCDSQWSNIIASFETSRTKWCTKSFDDVKFRFLRGYVSFHALHILNGEVERAKIVGESAEKCGCIVRQTHGLPCAREITKALNSNGGIARISIHEHWRTLSLDGRPSEDNIDPNPYIDDFRNAYESTPTVEAKMEFLQRLREATIPSVTSLSQPSIKINPRGRPKKRKSKANDDRSTKRLPSLFEHVEETTSKEEAKAIKEALNKVSSSKKKVKNSVIEKTKKFVHESFRDFIDDVIDVDGDGNYGFRAIAVTVGRHEDDWAIIRQELCEELRGDLGHYDDALKQIGRAEILAKNTDWKVGPCDGIHWMETPAILWSIANKYNAMVTLFTTDKHIGNLTCFPTKEGPKTFPPLQICLYFRINHYKCMKLKENCPLPTLVDPWDKVSNEASKEWLQIFGSRVAKENYCYDPIKQMN